MEPVIEEVMEEKDVGVEDIPTETPPDVDDVSSFKDSSERYFMCRAFAKFNRHEGCSRNWGSARAWCIIDLKEQCITHRFTQDCQNCEESVSPEYDDESVRRMADFAVKTFLRRSGRYQPDPFDFCGMGNALDGATNGPHDEGRCEICQQLGRPCWQ